ncbi:copper amine oxidase N-terminal domain-containing protein [Brevibacillus sp. H7]|uniref:copper amine oxidase N-terminal domain-containing protein n=1 Tax=Brevibacillus sp. H7 TaxID=3349138 RepID=UPI00381366C7
MKKFVVASIAAAMLLSPIAAYADTASSQPAIAAAFKLTADTSVQKADIQAFADIKKLFEAQTVDIAKVKAAYITSFQAKVQALIPDTDALIIAVLDGAAAGKYSALQAKQAVDKGLQGYFYAEITNLTKVVAKDALTQGKKDAARAALEQAIELYAGSLQATVGKRDASFSTSMQEQLDAIIIPKLLESVEKGDVLQYNITRQMFDKTLIKTFHLANITYAKKVPELAKTKPEDAKVGLTEGYFFYLPIYNSMSGGHKASADAIKAAFESGDVSKLSEAAIKEAFLKTLTAKLSGYVDKVLTADWSVKANHEKAMEQAMEGNMFLSVMEVLLTEKLGKDAYAALTMDAQKYFEAVQAADKAAATARIMPVLKALSALNGISFKAGDSTLLVNGKTVKIDVPSFIKNGRTLVPARALAEALGGKIDAVKVGTQMKIVIEKDGATIDFLIGSREINKDGKKLEYTFDQPALIKNGRTFIPLRAVSQVLGQKVFFDAANKTVIVLN